MLQAELTNNKAISSPICLLQVSYPTQDRLPIYPAMRSPAG